MRALGENMELMACVTAQEAAERKSKIRALLVGNVIVGLLGGAVITYIFMDKKRRGY